MGGPDCRLRYQPQRLARQVLVLGEHLGAVADGGNRAGQIVAQSRDQQLQDPHVETAGHRPTLTRLSRICNR